MFRHWENMSFISIKVSSNQILCQNLKLGVFTSIEYTVFMKIKLYKTDGSKTGIVNTTKFILISQIKFDKKHSQLPLIGKIQINTCNIHFFTCRLNSNLQIFFVHDNNFFLFPINMLKTYPILFLFYCIYLEIYSSPKTDILH